MSPIQNNGLGYLIPPSYNTAATHLIKQTKFSNRTPKTLSENPRSLESK